MSTSTNTQPADGGDLVLGYVTIAEALLLVDLSRAPCTFELSSKVVDGKPWLVVDLVSKNRDRGVPERVPFHLGMELPVPSVMPLDEARDLIYKACEELLVHELREQFVWRGARPFDPHAASTEQSK